MATKHQCIGGCGLQCPNKKTRPTPRVVETYKAPGAPGMGRWVTVQVLPATRRGASARGTAGSKRGYGPGSVPKGAKRAKKQNTAVRGAVPRIAATRWGYV